MRFIDKSLRREDFNAYTVKFLQDCLTPEGDFFPPVDKKNCYEAFSKPDYKQGRAFHTGKNGWLTVLAEEQNRHCCYCMKRISTEEVSVEHVIPESFENLDETEEYAFYASHSEEIKNYVELESTTKERKYLSKSEVASMVKFPHLVAHGNLTVACMWKKNGTEIGCCCNNVRGNERILPLMLMSDVEQNVKYQEDGSMLVFYPNTDGIVVDTIASLRLNNNTLVEVRMLWYKISLTEYNRDALLGLDRIGRTVFFKHLFNKNTFSEIDIRYSKYADGVNSDTPVYWNLLMQYDWYLDYYRANSPQE